MQMAELLKAIEVMNLAILQQEIPHIAI